MQTVNYWVRFGGLCSAHNYKNEFGNLSYSCFTAFRKQFACYPDNCVTLQIYLHIYVHIYEESQRTWKGMWLLCPRSLFHLDNGYSVFFFLYICAGMRLCRVQQQFYLLCSKSKPELVILCLGLSIDLEMVKEVRNMKYQVKLMQ